MQDGSDFSLPIEVVAMERQAPADDHAATTPFVRAPLPSPRHAWPPPASPLSPSLPPAPSLPLQPARSRSTKHPVPSRLKARRLLGVPPPPPTRAVPLSDDDERRMQRRVRAWRRIGWAQRMLERFHFDEATQ